MATIRSSYPTALLLSVVLAACSDDAATPPDARDAATDDGAPVDAGDPDAGGDLPVLGPLTLTIDPSLVPSQATLPPVPGDNSPRPVGVLAGPLGERVELVTDELVVFTDDAAALAALLTRWSGHELQTTALADVAGLPTMHLVRIAPAAAPATLAADLAALGEARGQPVLGDHRVSSQAVLDLLAAATAEAGRGLDAMPNLLGDLDSVATGVVLEADQRPVGLPRDACQWSYLAAGGAQDFAVCDGWRRLAAEGLLPTDDARVPVVVVDRGFDRSPDTPPGSRFWTDAAAAPTDAPPHPPLSGPPGKEWHGTGVSATLAAVPDNRWGVAGSGGPVARLLHVDSSTVTEDAIMRNLASVLRTWRDGGFGPDPRVVNLSFGAYLPSVASALTIAAEDAFFSGLRTRGVLVFAAAGNDGRDVDERARDRLTGRVFEPTRRLPCEALGVVCVGGLGDQVATRDPGSNRGGASVDEGTVDIYGPYVVYVPNDYGDTTYLDTSNYYLPNTSLAKRVTGTSFATPFVAGVATLLFAANPGLSADDVWATLRDTAHTGSPSPEVNRWVDASAAVDAVVAALRGGELCDGLDNDHDGATDEAPGGGPLTQPCYDGPAGTRGVGACHGGTATCTGGVWGACAGELTPRPDDDCDGVDDDCDGATDDAPTACVPAGATAAQMGVGICTWGQAACVAPGSFGACVGGQPPLAEVVPDGIDNDCDGHTDELDAPTGVTATTTLSDRVRVSWAPVAGATSYEVFRQGPLPADPVVSVGVTAATSFDDLTAPGYDAWSAIEVQNWIDYLRVVVSTVVDPAVVGADLRRRFTVRARQGAITSPSSGWALGGRVAAAPVDVQVAVEGAGDPGCTTDAQCSPTATCQAGGCRAVLTLPDHCPGCGHAEYDDATAPAPSLVAGTATASDGTYASVVELRLTGTAVAPGATRRYWGRVRTADGALAWAAGSGARAVAAGELSVRWQRSAADDAASPFTDIPGVSGIRTLDPYGSRDGSAHYYRAVVGASIGGLTPAISNADRGLAAPGHWTGVAVGDRHACALDGGHVVCWGDDEAGQASPPAGTFTQLEARAGYTCGLSAAGAVVCWGRGFAAPTTVSPPGVALVQFASGHDLGTGALELCGVIAGGAGTCFTAAGASVAGQPTGAWLRFVDPWCGVHDDGSAECFRGGYTAITAASYPGPFADIAPLAFPDGSGGLVGWRQDGTMTSQVTCQPPYCDDVPTVLAGSWTDVAFRATEWAPDPFGPSTAVCGVSAADGTLACEAPAAPAAPVLAEPGTCGAPYVDVALGAAATDGHQSACAIDATGALRCWGASPAIAAGPRAPEATGGARHGLALTSNVAAARRDDGTIATWGSPTGWYPALPPMAPTYQVFVDTIVPDVAHTYRLTVDGTLFTFTATFTAITPEAKRQTLDALAAAIAADPVVSARLRAVVETHRGVSMRLEPRVDGTAFTATTDDAYVDVVNVVPPGGVRAVAASGMGGLAITVDGRLAPWGPIEYREGTDWHQPPHGADFDAVTCGITGCCARRADHTLVCLQGYDVVGRCGDDHCANAEVGTCPADCADETGDENGDVPPEAIGVVPPTLAAVPFDAFAVGYNYCGVRADDHHLACWDANAAPVDPATTFLAPLAAAAPTAGFVQLVMSDESACGLDALGRAECASPYTTGLDVHAGPFVDLATTAEVTCGVRAGTGAGECWGALAFTRPGPYVNVEAAPAYAWRADMTCFETAGGRLDCAGDDASYLAPPPGDVVDVMLGAGVRCYRHTDGSLTCDGVAAPSTCAPWTSVEVDRYACGVTADGAARCWGVGAIEPPPGPWRVLSPGDTGTGCGLRPRPGDAPAGDGSVACWPAGAIDVPAPLVTPPAGTAYVEVQVGATNACARRDDGVVVCWGDATTGIDAVPTLAPGDRWAQIDLDAANACGRTEAGYLRCWGGGPNPPLPTPAAPGFRDLDLTGEYLCAVTATTEVRCYSTQSGGAPLSGPFMGSLPGAGYQRVANDAGYSVCGVRGDGSVVCSGFYTRW